MIDWLLPYIHIAAMIACTLLVATTALIASTAAPEVRRPAGLAALGLIFSGSGLIWVVVSPFPAQWFQVACLALWSLLSGVSAVLMWVCRPVHHDEPPSQPQEPPHTYPKINGQWRTPSDTQTIEAEQLRRTYRRKG